MHFQGESEVNNAVAAFQHWWVNVEGDWVDNAQKHFETEYAEPILVETPQLAQQMRQLADVFEQARREVE